MLKTLLLPVGDTTRVEKAVSQAVVIAKAFSARTHLLGMIQQSDPEGMHQFIDPVSWRATKNQKQVALTELAAELEAEKISTQLAMLDTSNFKTLIGYIQEGDFDLIIFTDDDQESRRLMRDVLAHTPIPVFIARDQSSNPYKRILLPLDGSQRAECMLSLATTLAQTLNATLLLTHIIKEPEMPRRTSQKNEDVQLAEQLIGRNRQEGERYLNDLSARLPVSSEVHILVHNSVTAALHEFIKQQDVDLVGLCTHGYSGKPEWPFGSIASNLIDYCAISLIVLQDLPSNLPSVEIEASGRPSGGH